MGRANSIYKRAKLRLYYAASLDLPSTVDDGGSQPSNLLQVLNAALKDCDASVNGGRSIVSTSGAGRSVTLALLTDYTPTDALALIEELLSLYERTTGESDAAKYAAMMAELKAPRRVLRAEYSGLRMEPTFN